MKKNQTVYKRVARGGFVQLSNDLVRDKRLSFGARGLLAMVLSNADEWVANRAYFVNNTTDGAHRVKTYFRELESLGYVKYELSGGGKAGFCNTWTFYDSPISEDQRSNRTNWRSSLSVLKDFGAREIPSTGELDHIRRPITQNTNIQNTINVTQHCEKAIDSDCGYDGEFRFAGS